MNKIICQCVSAKAGDIKISAGVKPILILELADKAGEIYVKFFNADRTPKGNITVGRNSDFAKLYRLAIGENPAARFSRADKLLSHFVGIWFDIKSESAISKRDSEYQRVTGIAPSHPIVLDGWTITGHLIKTARTKPVKNQAIFGQHFGKNQAIFVQFLGNCNPPQASESTGLADELNPISHSPYQIGTYHIPIVKIVSYTEGDFEKHITGSPPSFASQRLDKKNAIRIH